MSAPTPAPGTPQGEMTPAQQTAAAIAAQAQQRQQIASLADALIPQTQPGAIVSKAKIVGWADGLPPTVTIQLGGDTSANIPAVRYMDSYTPKFGDTVIVVKQGSELFVLGQIQEEGLSFNDRLSLHGWQTPALTTTWNASPTATPARWRIVYDNGAKKVQLQGRVWRNGSGTLTTLWTMPTEARPAVIRSMVAARENLSNGSNVIMVQALPGGALEISGQTLGAYGGNVGTTNATGDYGTDLVGNPLTSLMHTQGQPSGDHRHHFTHTHTVTVPSAAFPGWVSLDGLEYFL